MTGEGEQGARLVIFVKTVLKKKLRRRPEMKTLQKDDRKSSKWLERSDMDWQAKEYCTSRV